MIKTKQELLNYFSDINEMYNNPFMYQTLSNMIDELLEQQPCEDCKVKKEAYIQGYDYGVKDWFKSKTQPCEDAISKDAVLDIVADYDLNMDQVVKAIHALPLIKPHQEWIPVSDPLNELPKDRWLYVTTKVGCVETLVYDMIEWSDMDIARSTIAYMDYYEPQPYEAESED